MYFFEFLQKFFVFQKVLFVLFLIMWARLKLLVFVLSVCLTVCLYTPQNGGSLHPGKFWLLADGGQNFPDVVTTPPSLISPCHGKVEVMLGFAKNFEGIIDCCWTGRHQKMGNSSENWWVEWGFFYCGMFAEIYYILAIIRESSPKHDLIPNQNTIKSHILDPFIHKTTPFSSATKSVQSYFFTFSGKLFIYAKFKFF